MVMRAPETTWTIDPDDPRAPPDEIWDAMSPEERKRIVASLPTKSQLAAKETRQRAEEARQRAEEARQRVEAERRLAEAQAEAERKLAEVERKLAEAQAEIERLKGGRRRR